MDMDFASATSMPGMLYKFFVFTPSTVVTVNKCLTNLNSFDFLRQEGAHVFQRLFVYFVHDLAANTLIHLFLGTPPSWLYSNHLFTALTMWLLVNVYPSVLAIVFRFSPLFKAINVLLLVTLSINDITYVYNLPMYPERPLTDDAYTYPVLPSSTLGPLFIALVSAQTGELLKTCIIHYFKPGFPTSLTAPSTPWITVGLATILYHFFANPHAKTINSLIVHQYVSPLLAHYFLYGLFAVVFMVDAFRPPMRSNTNTTPNKWQVDGDSDINSSVGGSGKAHQQ